jgi:TolB-like protein/DNA-binding winged helix-turn-helix (wHTH) protein/Flp pilus assembly protein TadD
MPQPLSSTRLLRFGAFEVDLQAGELRKRGVRVKLQSQPFLLLVTLLKKQGNLVTREDLRATLWPDGAFVDFDHSLSTAVNKLREVLGDSATHPHFIETLPRRGYRFIAPVEMVVVEEKEPATLAVPPLEGQIEPAIPSSAAESAPEAARRRWRWAISWKAAGFLVFLIPLAFFVLGRFRTSPPQSIRSLAVLPLENLSGDASQDYFSDGMTDELITKLGQISELRVISRSSVMSYKNVNKPVRQIARELDVDAVIEGTVVRAGSQIRITAQLIDAHSDRHLWAQDYEGDLRNTLALQNKVARDIADQIRIKLSSEEQFALKDGRVVNAESHEAYLKGRFFWNKRTGDDLKKAVEYFNLASAKDPNYAQAFSGLADSYALMGDWEYGVLDPKDALPKAREAATKALALDNSLSEPHTSLAFALDLYDWDWKSAETEFKRAIELNPNYATAHQWYAWHLAMVGRNGEAVQEMKKAENLDPLSLIISADMADILLIVRRFDESIKQSRKTLEMDFRFAIAHYELGQALAQQRMFTDAIEELQRAIEFSDGNKIFASNLAYIYAIAGKKDKARELLANLMNASQGFSNASEIALVYVGLGEKDQAMNWLEKAYKERFNPSVLLRPCFDPLRSDPRFQDLMRRIALNN